MSPRPWSLNPLVAALVGLCLTAETANANDIVDFLKKWGDAQRGYDNRQSQWDQRFRDRYQPLPNRPVEPLGPSGGVPFRLPQELSLSADQCGLSAGHYDFPLYGHEAMHLVVTPGTGGAPINAVDTRAVLSEVDLLVPHIETVLRSVRSTNDRDLIRSGDDAQRELTRVRRALERNDIPDARSHHDRFSADWQRFHASLSRYRLGTTFQQHLTAIERHEHRLDALFRQRGRTWDYDRPRLFGLSHVLSQQAATLDDTFQANPNDWRAKALDRQIRRVRFCADGFAEAVRDNADYETLVDEYRIFDEAWHYVLERSGRLAQYPGPIVSIGRDIWEIDAALADVLLIDPPSLDNNVAARNVVDRFASAARRLERELDFSNQWTRDRRYGSWGLTQQCARLAAAATALERRIELQESMSNAQQEYAELAEAWREARQTARSLPSVAMPSGMTSLLLAMDSDFNRIERSYAGDFGWRYALARR